MKTFMTVGISDNVFDAYDFQRKGFPINEFIKTRLPI